MKKLLFLLLCVFSLSVNAQSKYKQRDTVITKAIYVQNAGTATVIINNYIKNGWMLKQSIVCPISVAITSSFNAHETSTNLYPNSARSELILIFTYKHKYYVRR